MNRIRFGGVGLLILISACAGGEAAPAVPTATLLTPEGVNHIQSQFSPDGSRVAWWMPGEDGWNLMIAKSDLSGARIASRDNAQTSAVVWSPDGRELAIVASATSPADIFILPADSGAGRQLTTAPGFEFPRWWSPRGNRLSYAFTGEGGVLRGGFLDPVTGASTPLPLTTTPFAAWSPDGTRLVLEAANGNAGIWVADSAGENPKQLTTEKLEGDARWSPDGTELAYVSRRTGTGDIWVIPAGGGSPRQLTHDIREDNSPRWSPDGKWIAFISQRGRQSDIWVVPAAGGTEIRVTDDVAEEGGGSLQWVGRRHTLAYHTGISGQSLWAITVNDGKERQLTPDSIRISQIYPSPDGKEVVYEVLRGGGVSHLMVMPIAGGVSRMLVSGSSINSAPNWSPDGKSIVFLSNRAGNFDVWIVPAVGGEPRPLTSWPSNEGLFNAAQWSPDGTEIYFLSDREASLAGDVWKVPAAGGEPTRLTRLGTISSLAKSLVSPDIFVTSLGGKEGRTVMGKVRPDGQLQVLWDKSSVTGLSWLGLTPTGDSISMGVNLPSGGIGSYLVDTRTGGGRPILSKNDNAGDFSPNGEWLAYWAGTITQEISLLNMKDGTTKQLTHSPEAETTYWWTSDNNTIVFQRFSARRRIATVDLSKLLAAPVP